MSDIIFKGGEAKGYLTPTPSKSHTHRAIIMAALAEGRSTITNPLISLDTEATMEAVSAMGATVTREEGRIIVEGGNLHAPEKPIDVKNSGTTLRLLTGICSSFGEEVTLTGDESIQKRPMGPLLDSLSAAGVKCTSNDGKAPVTVCGPVTGNMLTISGGVSSQFVSSLLMTAPITGQPTTIKVTGNIVSEPYLDITVGMMSCFGIHFDKNSLDERMIRQSPFNRQANSSVEACKKYSAQPQKYQPTDYLVPGDFSAAAFPFVAAGLTGSVTIRGLDIRDPQGDRRILNVLQAAGCAIAIDGKEITVSAAGRPRPLDINMSTIPDLFPIVAVLLATADGKSRLWGAPHLRFKESDRIAMTEQMLKALGADITATDDGCIINGVEKLHGGRVEHHGDHRIMMAAAVASLVADGPVVMENDGCWNVSYPGFIEQMKKIGLKIE